MFPEDMECSFPQSPLPLSPSCPISPARRTRRLVRTNDGQVVARRVLQRSRGVSNDNTPAYIIQGMLCQQDHGVSLLLASPARPASARAGTTCLVESGGPPVAIKAVPRPEKRTSATSFGDNPYVEIAALELVQHPNVIRIRDRLADEKFVYLILDHVDGGDLYAHLRAKGGAAKGLPEGETAHYLQQMVAGLLYMKRSQGISHRDVSLENVMVSKEGGRVRMVDLGMAMQVGVGANRGVWITSQRCHGKRSYVAPEVAREEPFDPFAADVWSLGVCLYAMLTGRPLYTSPDDAMFRILSNGGAWKVLAIYESHGLKLSPTAKDLIIAMLDKDPAKRPTLEQILQDRFLQENTMMINRVFSHWQEEEEEEDNSSNDDDDDHSSFQ